MDVLLTLSSVITYAGAQNFIEAIQQISLTNHQDQSIDHVVVCITADPLIALPLTLNIAQIAAGQTYTLNQIEWPLSHDLLVQQTETMRANICVEVRQQDQLLAQHMQTIDVLAYNDWSGFRQLPELLAAFVQPNSQAVSALQRQASTKLLQQFQQPLCGYQASSREAVCRQIGAIYAAITDWDIHYANPPASFTGTGQKIRLPDQIQQERIATCLDTTLLMVSCLEQAGLNPLIFLQDSHAWVGCWLVDQSLPISTVDDQAVLRKRIDAGELLAIESIGVTPQSHLSFAQAVQAGAQRLAEQQQHRFELAIDVQRARQGLKILPLSLRSSALPTETVIDEQETTIEEIALPTLSTDIVVNSTNDTTRDRNRVDIWRSKLLDLTLRNKLINFKESSKQAVPLFTPQPEDVENLLAQGKALKLKSLLDLMPEQDPRALEHQARSTQATLQAHLSRQALSKQELLADLDGDQLDKRLTEIFRNARTAQEEGGANTLFLVFGMLQWTDSKDRSRSMRAPMVMVPVTLERQSVNSAFVLRRHDDDTIVNPTLLQLLEYQFELKIPRVTHASELPQDESGVDIAAIWASFRSAVVDLSGFEVIPSVWLGLFSFTKYLMWKDLTDRLDDILKSPLVRHLMQPNEQQVSPLAQGHFLEEASLDEARQPQDLFIPADCDSSQLAAVNAAADGLSFVLEGPPGTGKSQTITNIIADALARGKTVLFVSEKIAALSVVHDRLKKLGLAPFLLELHSAKATKSEVLAQFDRALKSGSRHTVTDWMQEAQRLNRLRQGLNDYVKALHQRHTNGLTVFRATGLLIRQHRYPACDFHWPSPDVHTAELLDQMREIAKQIETTGDLIPLCDREHLKGIGLTDWSPHWQRQFEQQAQTVQQAIDAMQQACLSVESILKIETLADSSFEGWEWFDALCGVLLQYEPDYIALLDTADAPQQHVWVEQAIHAGQHLHRLEAQLYIDWLPEICQQPISDVLVAWRQSNRYWLFKKWLAQFRMRNMLREFHINGLRPETSAVIPLLDLVIHTQQAQHAFTEHTVNAQQTCGALWAGQQTDWTRLAQAQTWRAAFETRLQQWLGADLTQQQAILAQLLGLLQQHPKGLLAHEPIGRVLREWQQAHHHCRDQYRQLLQQCGLSASLPMHTTHILNQIRRDVRGWQESVRYLRDWCNWQQLKQSAYQLGLKPLTDVFEAGQLAWSQASDFFEYRYADWWVAEIFSRTPALTRFSAVDHERKIQEFRDTDARFAELTKQYIYAKVAEKIPASELAPAQTPLGILKREIQKKTRHMPVRKLLATTSDLLSHLAPCMLMSPLSVAQYLDAANTSFDLVIFDEASQIPTWDAIGAIARGKQVIVVGDPKQLPPTSFFSSGQSDDGTADDIQDLESILDECLGSGMRVHTLKWHYRSQKESLITFSNHRYYDAQLITFPSPTHPDNGVTFHHVDGVYQRAGARNNRQEAEAVVTFIEQHLQADQPNPQSIGVVTFSQAQQQLIEDLLDAARRKNPVLDRQIQALTNEPLFVKNLENVQGDERDIILFSICYGPDETGRVAMNFGPLNRDGGHRRLNVAITRAKTQIHLFSTLHPDQLDLSRSKARGVADLKHYLQFAIQGAPALVAQTSPTGLSPDSPFEVEVLNHLLDQGWQVHCQVGCSSYRIDLAVVDPRAEGRYLLAIECDGASYHSAATARDRDKLRQMVLERLGWTVHRIWSTEWWTNREREQQRLQKAIQQAMQQAESASQSSALIATSDHQSTDIEVQVNATPAATYASHTPDVVFDAVDALAGPSDMQTTTVAKHYVATVLKAADPDRFFEPSENTHLVQMMQQVIVEEGPVIDRIIIKRVIDAYGFKRIGNRIQLRLAQLLSTLPNQESASQTVYWPVHLNPETWCDYREMGERDVADIPVIEMAQCAKQMLMQLVVAEEEALIKTMGNSFGMGRVTRQSQDKLRAGVDLLQAIGQIEHTASGWR